ncbi:bifunctional riboflavin kinase/FAD synthetase [Virgibacillus sp. W0430]|uniref:bifunctional riboflavin kinase/FAD synthetase n=1 Tax=Virgibacillus sp. W0430 TaxID=3391580 RepID=UPI003F460D2D
METIHLSYPHPYQKEVLPEAVAAIGFFDGVHKGHQEVIKTAVRQANINGMESAVITFFPHPSVILNKDIAKREVKYITPLEEKKAILQNLQVDRLYIVPFNKELSSLSPQQFIDHFIIGLRIKHLVAGFDFSFGHKGSGNMQNIDRFTRGAFTFEAVAKVESDQMKISSTSIRTLLKQGNIQKANALLGRNLTITGLVVEGDKRGRTIGFPTANLQLEGDEMLPKPGVYAVKVSVQHDKRIFEGMANLGTKPTFTNDTDLSLEVHLLDFTGDLYEKKLSIEWHAFIREEKKFNGVEELIQQLKRDEKKVQHVFQTCK